jgi:hemin uptake protein HemP
MTAACDKDAPGRRGKEGQISTSAEREIKVVNGRIDSRELFVQTREIIITHGDDLYRLRLTAQNKLILTK